MVDLSLGASHGVALTADGALYAWGTYERAQITRPVPQLLQVLNPSFKANGKIINLLKYVFDILVCKILTEFNFVTYSNFKVTLFISINYLLKQMKI